MNHRAVALGLALVIAGACARASARVCGRSERADDILRPGNYEWRGHPQRISFRSRGRDSCHA